MKKKYRIISVLISIVLIIILVLIHLYNTGRGKGLPIDETDFIKVKSGTNEFLVRTKGDSGRTPVILLHGFPESAVMWKKTMQGLAGKGYYCAAPNQRGYSPGARPGDVSAYRLDLLRDDVIAIADSLGIKKFHLVGHDWGCAVGWAVAEKYPERLYSFSALSIPHLEAFSRAYRESREQYEASDYIRKIKIPLLPEFKMAENDYTLLKKIYTHHSKTEIDFYVALFSQRNALTSMLNWYRANYRGFTEGFSLKAVKVPTLFIWGKNDKAVHRHGAELTSEYVLGPYQFMELEAGHWLIQESHDTVMKAIENHIKKY